MNDNKKITAQAYGRLFAASQLLEHAQHLLGDASDLVDLGTAAQRLITEMAGARQEVVSMASDLLLKQEEVSA